MTLSTPAIDSVMSGDDRCTRCRSAKARNSPPATLDRFDASFDAHDTVGVLSQNAPMRWWRRFTRYSKKM